MVITVGKKGNFTCNSELICSFCVNLAKVMVIKSPIPVFAQASINKTCPLRGNNAVLALPHIIHEALEG